jgi:kynurenine formamidase
MTEIIDLSQEIYTKHPLYHTHPDTVIWTDTTHEDSAYMFGKETEGEAPFTYEASVIQMCDHGPTHVDAIKHLKEGGTPINKMPLDTFFGPGEAIAVSHRTPGEYITVDDLESACDDADVTIEEGNVVLIHTGHFDATYPEREYTENYPGLNEAATQWLIDNGVKNFGIDQPSPDTPEDVTYPCHQVCRDNEVPHIENLRNIDQVIGKNFTFAGFPLNIRDGTGSPIRAVAILD